MSVATFVDNLATLWRIIAPNAPTSANIGDSFATAPKSVLIAYMLTDQVLATSPLMSHAL